MSKNKYNSSSRSHSSSPSKRTVYGRRDSMMDQEHPWTVLAPRPRKLTQDPRNTEESLMSPLESTKHAKDERVKFREKKEEVPMTPAVTSSQTSQEIDLKPSILYTVPTLASVPKGRRSATSSSRSDAGEGTSSQAPVTNPKSPQIMGYKFKQQTNKQCLDRSNQPVGEVILSDIVHHVNARSTGGPSNQITHLNFEGSRILVSKEDFVKQLDSIQRRTKGDLYVNVTEAKFHQKSDKSNTELNLKNSKIILVDNSKEQSSQASSSSQPQAPKGSVRPSSARTSGSQTSRYM